MQWLGWMAISSLESRWQSIGETTLMVKCSGDKLSPPEYLGFQKQWRKGIFHSTEYICKLNALHKYIPIDCTLPSMEHLPLAEAVLMSPEIQAAIGYSGHIWKLQLPPNSSYPPWCFHGRNASLPPNECKISLPKPKVSVLGFYCLSF